MVDQISLRLGIALIVLGAVLGFVPAFGGVDGSGNCGSPFIANDDLDESSRDGCEVVGGLADRRAWALGFGAAGVVLVVGRTRRDTPAN